MQPFWILASPKTYVEQSFVDCSEVQRGAAPCCDPCERPHARCLEKRKNRAECLPFTWAQPRWTWPPSRKTRGFKTCKCWRCCCCMGDGFTGGRSQSISRGTGSSGDRCKSSIKGRRSTLALPCPYLPCLDLLGARRWWTEGVHGDGWIGAGWRIWDEGFGIGSGWIGEQQREKGDMGPDESASSKRKRPTLPVRRRRNSAGERRARMAEEASAGNRRTSAHAASPRRRAHRIAIIERRNESFLHSAVLVVSTGLVASVDLISSCRNHFYIFSSLSLFIPMSRHQKGELWS